MQSMQRAYGLRVSQCHANQPASGDCSAPTHSNVTCPSVLTSQTASALLYNDQRVAATSVCGRCFDIHVTSDSLPAGPGQSSSDDLARSQCALLAAAPIAKRQFTCHQLLMSESQVTVQAHNTPCPHVRRSFCLPLIVRFCQDAGQCLSESTIHWNTPQAPHASSPTAAPPKPCLRLA